MNWSYGIILSFVFFVVFILSLVYKTMNTEVDLVAEDYYAQEIAYQDVIDGKENYQDSKRKINIHQTADSIVVEFVGDQEEIFSGTLLFFRPSDKKMDRSFEWEGQQLSISKEDFFTGQYVLKAKWNSKEKSFYHEKPIFVQR